MFRSHKNTLQRIYKKDKTVCEPQPVDKSVKLLIPPNCLTLWNSKTIHANEGMKKAATRIKQAYMLHNLSSKERRTEEIRKQRINAYLTANTTSHGANKCELKRYPFGFKLDMNWGLERSGRYPDEETVDGVFKKKIPLERYNLV